MSPARSRVATVSTTRVGRGLADEVGPDDVVCEEPFEIRVRHPRHGVASVGVTMRTPGDDDDLVVGYLVSEGIVSHVDQIGEVAFGGGRDETGRRLLNVVEVGLTADARGPRPGDARVTPISAACGLCGRNSIDSIEQSTSHSPLDNGAQFALDTLLDAAASLGDQQTVFRATGGCHAAGLVRNDGSFAHVREDIGRHNAVDKTLGAAWRAGELPLGDAALIVSGRAGFELVQKAAMSGVAALVAVSAPSALAVELATEMGVLLVGFTRGDRARVYAGAGRLVR